MDRISEPGSYSVRITECFHKPLDFSNDPEAFAILLKGVTETGKVGFASFIFSHRVVGGRTSTQWSMHRLEQLGVPRGWPGLIPDRIAQGWDVCFLVKKGSGRKTRMKIFAVPIDEQELKGSPDGSIRH